LRANELFLMTLTYTRDAHTMEQSISPTGARNDSPQSRSDESLAVRKRRIKAHRKSRGGCMMCKTRKVKVTTVPEAAKWLSNGTWLTMDTVVL
jgi:hypothetical protein